MIDDREFRYLKINADTYSLFDESDFCIGEIKLLDGDVVFNPLNVHYKIYDFTQNELSAIIKIMALIEP